MRRKRIRGGARISGLAIVGACLLYLGPAIEPAAATTLPSTISSDTTLTAANSPYTSSGSVTVSSGVTLTVEPGVQVKMGGTTAELIVNGTLNAQGTAGSEIVFTSTADNAVNQWRGIRLDAGSGSSVLDHVEVRRAGYQSYAAVSVNAGSPTISNSNLHDNGGTGMALGGASPTIAANIISDNLRNGIYGSAASGTSIHDNTVEDNRESGIYVTGSATSLSDNVITSNGAGYATAPALYFLGSGGGTGPVPPDIDENTLTGNANGDVINVGGKLEQSTTWQAGAPFIGSLTVASGVTLTLEPGFVFKAAASLSSFTVNGTLNAQGTGALPITFTSKADSNAGQWKGLSLEAGSGASVLDHVEVRRAGYQGYAAIAVNAGSPTISNSSIYDNSGNGITISTSGPEIANNTISDSSSGIYASTATGAAIHGNDVDSNHLNGIYVIGSATTLSGNTVANNGVGSTAQAFTFTGSGGGTGPVPPDIDENTLTGNANGDIINVGGRLEQSTTWQSGLPFVGSLTVASGVTLTLEPGFVFKAAASGSVFTVNGTLDAQGTDSLPITFTSKADSNPSQWKGLFLEAGSGGSVLEHVDIRRAGYQGYGAITVNGGSPTITKSTIHDNGSSGVLINGGSPTITKSVLTKNAQGFYVGGGTSPTIRWNRIHGNTNYGVYYTGTGVLPAPNNYWGCTAPKPAGCGDLAPSNVGWAPTSGDSTDGEQCNGRDHHCPVDSDPVSLATGALTYAHTDLALTNAGDPLVFARTYNSLDATDAGLGPGWAHQALMTATDAEDGDVLIQRFDGRADLYADQAGGTYGAPSGVSDKLTKIAGGTYQLTALEGTVYDFRLDGRIDKITDDHGLVTDYVYDSNGRLSSITDSTSQALTFAYNASNHITKVADSAGREISFTYTTAGDLDTVTDALGGVTDYGYDAQHRLTTIKDPRGVTFLTNTYDSQGRVIEQRDALNHLWTIDYGTGQTTVTEPEGGTKTYTFDSQLRTSSMTDQLGHTTTYDYDAAGNLDQITEPGAAVTQMAYDSAGNLTSVTDPEGGVRSYAYDSLNRLTSFTDERTKVWSYTWNSANDLTAIDGPGSSDYSLTYNSAGQPLTVTDPNSHTTTYAYGTHGVLSSVTDPLSHTTSYGYDAYNQLTSVTRPGLAAEAYTRNKLGDLLTTTTPEGHTTTFGYDANGALTSITDPALKVWTIERDGMERPITYTDPLLNETTIAYDANLNPVSVTDRNSHTTTYAYDLANQLTEVDAPATGSWQFGYDARGNRDEMTDPRGNVTAYAYDLADRLTQANEPETTTSSYDYNPAGLLSSLTDPNGHTTTFDYNDLGLLTAINQPLPKITTFAYDAAGRMTGRATAEDALTLAYDNSDRLTSISNGTTTLRRYGYDNVDRLTSATDAQAKELAFGYDDDGNLTSIDDDRGQTVSRAFDSRGNLTSQADGRGTLGYAYDELNRITQLTDPQSDAIGFEYDPEGNLTETTLPNGVVTTNTYDGADRLLQTSSVNGTTVMQDFTYVYDPAGNRTSTTDRNNDVTTYAYDDLNRLTQFDPPASPAVDYGYDDVGNRTSAAGTTYTYNALNQLVDDSAGNDYGYDSAGRLTGIVNGTDSVTYEWDALDQLIGVDDGTTAVGYSYDGLGRRSERTSGTTETAHYSDLGDAPTLDTGSSGVVRSWIHGPAGETATAAAPTSLVEQEDSAGVAFPLIDAHGDVTTVADDAGAVGSRQEFDPWGGHLSGPQLPMGWLGGYSRRSDPAVGLVQMGFRSYAPNAARFMAEDPVIDAFGRGQALNRESYVGNNPMNRFDLPGRCFVDDVPLFSDACDFAGEAAQDVVTTPVCLIAGATFGQVGCPEVTDEAPESVTCATYAYMMVGGPCFSQRLLDFVKNPPCHEIGLGLDGLGVIFNAVGVGAHAIPGPQGQAISGGATIIGGLLDLGGVGLAMLHEGGVC